MALIYHHNIKKDMKSPESRRFKGIKLNYSKNLSQIKNSLCYHQDCGQLVYYKDQCLPRQASLLQ